MLWFSWSYVFATTSLIKWRAYWCDVFWSFGYIVIQALSFHHVIQEDGFDCCNHFLGLPYTETRLCCQRLWLSLVSDQVRKGCLLPEPVAYGLDAATIQDRSNSIRIQFPNKIAYWKWLCRKVVSCTAWTIFQFIFLVPLLRVKQNKGKTDFHHHFEGSTPAGEINSSNAPQLAFHPSHQDLHDW